MSELTNLWRHLQILFMPVDMETYQRSTAWRTYLQAEREWWIYHAMTLL